ncbi:hypothetical protein F383_08061 [Gossypium arboreum]|uniref:Uncharacterized protein n=1 Tax=Gossypium arboreum TaxID=29729 RepID=A0A0B0PHI0_GOSAR|nr:hypothetical protein F383_08061 [Gossypium arboreum]
MNGDQTVRASDPFFFRFRPFLYSDFDEEEEVLWHIYEGWEEGQREGLPFWCKGRAKPILECRMRC